MRTSRPLPGMEQQLRAAVSAVDAQLPLATVRSMDDVLASVLPALRIMRWDPARTLRA